MPDSIPPAPCLSPLPYLSIVCAVGMAQRRDAWWPHVGAFVRLVIAHAERTSLPLEIILVERSEPGARPACDGLLRTLAPSRFAELRVIHVPMAENEPVDRERQAQNIGIRRARGAFVLAAGTDIVLTTALMDWIATRPLREETIYRPVGFATLARFPAVTPSPGEAELACRAAIQWATQKPFAKPCVGTDQSMAEAWDALAAAATLDAAFAVQRAGGPLPLSPAPGGFVLMGRESWQAVGGFPEWDVGDEHLDRIVTAQAHLRGWPTVVPPKPCYYYQLLALRAPDPSSLIYVDAQGDTRVRIRTHAVPDMNYQQVLRVLGRIDADLSKPAMLHINGPGWGLDGVDLAEISIAPT